MAMNKTFVRLTTEPSLADQNSILAKPPKIKPLAATEAYGNRIEASGDKSDSESEEPPCSRFSGRRTKKSSCRA